MRIKYPMRCVVAGIVGAAALSLLLSGGVMAQAPAGGDTSKSSSADALAKFNDVKITLESDKQNLVEALRTMMKSAKADFVIDNELKEGTATVHFTDLPFKDALNTLVKVATIPIKYELKDGVFHFSLRVDPPVADKPADPAAPARKQSTTGKVPLDEVSAANILRKLTGRFDTPADMIYQHSTLPGSHGSSSSSGFSGNGRFQSNSFTYNPDGSISRSGTPSMNILGLLRGLFGGR